MTDIPPSHAEQHTGPSGEPLMVLLAETVARHFDDARVLPRDPDDGLAVAAIGLGGIDVLCPEPRSVNPWGADNWAVMLTVWIRGGAFGTSAQAVNLSGYGPTPAHAVLQAGCLWACSFGGLLKSAFAGAPVDEQSDERYVTLDGRRFRALFTAVDRWLSEDDEAGARAARAVRDAAGGWLTTAVLDSGTLPVLPSDRAVSLGTFLGVVAEPLPEVKVHGGDWPPSLPVLARLADAGKGPALLLRDYAILLPQAPFHGFDRSSLQRTLAGLAASRQDPGDAAGWRGWRRHGGQLGPPLTTAELETLRRAAGGPLPPAYEHFVTTVAARGAGPGYGLEPPCVRDGAIVLAHAGCGVHWELRLSGEGRGEVWVDASVLNEPPHRVAASFDDWYAAWLEAAIGDTGPWRHWDNSSCSPVAILSQFFEAQEAEHPGDAERWVRSMGANASITVTGQGFVPEGTIIDPCHPCLALFAEFDFPETCFAIGFPTVPAGKDGDPSRPEPTPRRGLLGRLRRRD